MWGAAAGSQSAVETVAAKSSGREKRTIKVTNIEHNGAQRKGNKCLHLSRQ